MARLAPFALALLSGLAHALSIAAPWDGMPLWWLQLASLAVLAGQLRRERSWRRAGLLGWTFAAAWLTATFWWLFISMHQYGGLSAPLAILAVLALATFLAGYYAAACAAFSALATRGTGASALLFAALWLLAELARGVFFTGFPWGATGYAHLDGPLVNLAPWLGVYGMTLAAAAVAMGLGAGRPGPGLAAAAALLLALALGQVGGFSNPAATTSVALLQGNIAQEQKFEGGTGVPLALAWYADQFRRSSASLVVAPETAIPRLPHQLPEGYLRQIGERFAQGSQAALIGIPLGGRSTGYSNSVIGLKPDAPVYRFDKHHLVPFGEFVPPLFRWFTDLMRIPLGDFNRGAVGQGSFEWQGQRFAPNICYEDLFGEELGARFADPALAPTVFVNVSNIGWFGNTIAIDQHLQISRLRALEFQRPMIRATNTGATAIIDHTGRVSHLLPRHTRGVLLGQVQGRTGMTPFAWWVSRLGLWPWWLLGLGVVLLVGLAGRGKRLHP